MSNSINGKVEYYHEHRNNDGKTGKPLSRYANTSKSRLGFVAANRGLRDTELPFKNIVICHERAE